jgi:hypothetical protein
LQSALKEFRDYKKLGDKTFEQISEKDLHFQPNEECNSIAVNIQHMHGNMLSRWTNFLTEDGEKEWRKRDEEFQVHSFSKEKLIGVWEEGWKLVFDTIGSLTDDDLTKPVYIRGKPHTVIGAINRQVSHYSYHVGQIVLLAKMIKASEWQTLSIPRKKV